MLVFSVWSVSVSTNLPVARKLNSNHHPGNNGAQYDWDWPWHQLRDGRPQRQLLHNGSATTDDKCPHYGSSTQGQILLSRADDALPELNLSSASTSSYYYWSLLYRAILRSPADSLRSHVILHEWIAFYSAFLNIHRSGVLTALAWLVPLETSKTTHLCAPGGRLVLCWLEEGQSYTDFVFPCSIYRKLCQVLCSVECSLLNSGVMTDRDGHRRVTSPALSADQTRLRLFPLF